MKRLFAALPVWAVLADMLYGFGLNIMQSFALGQEKLPADGLPVSPEIAFSGLQVLANGGMIAVIGFGLLVLLRLNAAVVRRTATPIGPASTLGLVAVLAFSLPSLWEWFWALAALIGGTPAISFDNPRYLLTALCLPYIALLCICRLAAWYRLAKTQHAEPESAESDGAAQT